MGKNIFIDDWFVLMRLFDSQNINIKYLLTPTIRD